MDRYLNLVRLPQNDSDAVGPKGFQAMLLGPGSNEQVNIRTLSCMHASPEYKG